LSRVSDFTELVAELDYPMYIVTAAADGERAGCLVGFGTQTSIHPERFLVCISVKNHTLPVAEKASLLAVHVPSEEPAEQRLAELFGSETGDKTDKFAHCAWHRGPGDVPILDAAAAWFSGPILSRTPLGDHVGFLIEPDTGECPDLIDVITFRDVQHLEPGHEA